MDRVTNISWRTTSGATLGGFASDGDVAGRGWSAATGLVNFRMRWYDAETGRWLSKDPIGLSGGLNLYVFCGSEVVNNVDPYGQVSNVPISGTDYNGRVELQAENRNSNQMVSKLWHVDVHNSKGAKVWSGKFDGFGNYVGKREGYSASDIAKGDLEAVKRWTGPKIRKQVGALPPQSRPPIKGSGRCGSGPVRGGSGGGFGGGYGQFLSPYLLL